MIGNQERWQEDLFVAGPLRDLIPDEHVLKRVDKVLDLSWLRQEVRDCYCIDNGRPGIDPEAAVRLMVAGLFQGIVHDRKLVEDGVPAAWSRGAPSRHGAIGKGIRCVRDCPLRPLAFANRAC